MLQISGVWVGSALPGPPQAQSGATRRQLGRGNILEPLSPGSHPTSPSVSSPAEDTALDPGRWTLTPPRQRPGCRWGGFLDAGVGVGLWRADGLFPTP